MNPQDLDDIRKQAEFDRFMSAARVERMRGDYTRAAASVQQALKIWPEDPGAREFAADVLLALGQLEKATEVYKELFQEDATRASAEEKYAKVTLQVAEGKRQKELLLHVADHPAKFAPAPRSPLIAALLSSAPGFGQIYCGQFVKGVVLFVVSMISWFFFYLSSPDVSNVPEQMRMATFIKNMNPLAVIFACIAVSLQVYAFVDAPVYASKLRDKETKSLTEPRA
ncbi:MAG: tetratricopeptide repeat protein [Chloroflexi bacterium]|nr:tetratricopeptide repeat protein [Chloroflexota bacterium]